MCGYSEAIGSFTFSNSSDSPHTSSTETIARTRRGSRWSKNQLPVARRRFDEHLVAALNELARAGRGQRDAVLVGLDLPLRRRSSRRAGL